MTVKPYLNSLLQLQLNISKAKKTNYLGIGTNFGRMLTKNLSQLQKL